MTSRSYFGKMNSILGSVVPLAMFIYYWNILKTLWMKESHDLFPPPHPLNASPLKFTFYPPAQNHLNDCSLGIIPNPFSPHPASKTWHILGLGSSRWYMVSTHGHQFSEMDTFNPGKTNYNYMFDLGSSLYNQCNVTTCPNPDSAQRWNVFSSLPQCPSWKYLMHKRAVIA